MVKKQFKAESKKLLDLMIHSIYTNKEIFLREIISNASDAIDKLLYLSLTDENVGMSRNDFAIEIIPNQEEKTITVKDNGIGMDKKTLEDNLGTIAKSGSLSFREEMPKEDAQDIDIIGQFGVGFYSAFMVSDKVEVISRAYGSEEAYRWVSNGADGYTIETADKQDVGTEIIMTLKEDTDDEQYSRFLWENTLQGLIKKYSDYIRYPIRMEIEKTRMKAKEDENAEPEYETYREVETINSMIPIWRRNKNEIKQEEYDAFYQQKFMDFNKPQKTIHIKAEGLVSYDALLFVPSQTPYNYYTKEYKSGLQLYSSGVLIMENAEALLPEHFRFVKGVVDSQDVSLNISRELLQQDMQVKAIAKSIDNKIHRELSNMLKNDRADYEKFFKNFGLQLKYGVVSDFGINKEHLQDLLLFATSAQDTPTTLTEYVDRMKEDQTNIYYATGDTLERVAALPQTEYIRDKGYEILYLTNEVDEFVMQTLVTYQEKVIKSVNDDDLDVDETNKEKAKKAQEENEALFTFMKETLGDKVTDIKASERLKSHPVILSSQGAVSLEMEKYFAQMPGQEEVKAQKVLEVNTDHPIFHTLQNAYTQDEQKAKDLTNVLYAQGLLIAGFPIENPTEYTDILTSLLSAK